MGKLILCSGKYAMNPYQLSLTHTKIYSVEELCYYIRHNITCLSEELYDEKIADFFENELGLSERAELIRKLINKRAGIKDIIAVILCSCDMYNKEEIEAIIKQTDEFYRLSKVQQQKWIADRAMKHKQYKEAMARYKQIKNSSEVAKLSSREYGDLLHNIGVIYAYQGNFKEAAVHFLDAYERNAKPESLKQYLFILKISGDQKQYEKGQKLYVNSRELLTEVEEQLGQVEKAYLNSRQASNVNYLMEMYNQGKTMDYYRKVADLISEFKQEYRQY